MADDTLNPAVTRVLHALTADLHGSLCGCSAYPDSCVSKSGYRRDDLVHTFGHAEAALEEALKQGWTPPASSDTPPVAGETPDAALDAAAAAVVNYTLGAEVYDTFADFQRAHWRKAMAAALPHLTADLRSYLASSARTGDDLRGVITAKTGEIERLLAERDALLARDAAWKAHVTHLESRLFDIWVLTEKTASKCNDLQHDQVCEVVELACYPAARSVLNGPAPSTPEHLDVDQLPADRIEKLAQWLHGRNIGICEMDSNDVYNGIESMRELAQALLQHGPDGIRITAPSTPAAQENQA